MKNAAIVGCGNIAGFLDKPSDEKVLTHAHAYRKYPNTQLVAVCDPSVQQRENFISRWGEKIRHYESIQELLDNESIHIISICSPTSFHFEAMIDALKNKNIRTIICEKPFIQTQEELDELSSLLKKSDKKILINFLRRYDPSIQKIHDLISTQSLGEVVCFNAKFTKGIYHNGSHMLELIEYLCGDITSLSAKDITAEEDDLYGSFFIKTDSSTGILQNFSGKSYALFELEIILSQGRVLIKDAGHTIQIETLKPSKKYEGYFSLEHEMTLDDTMDMSLFNTIDFALNSTVDCFKKHLRLSQKLLDIRDKLQKQHTLNWSIHE